MKLEKDIKFLAGICVFFIGLLLIWPGKIIFHKFIFCRQLVTATDIGVAIFVLIFIAFIASLPILIIRWETRKPKIAPIPR